jgi:hypothetical protein
MLAPFAASCVIAAALLALQARSTGLLATGAGLQSPGVPPEGRNPQPVARNLPRTPWGDPDLQGTWTSDDMRGIPRERPDEFGSRQFLTDEEFARRATQDEQTLRQQLRGPYGGRNDLRSRTFRQTSLVVDPPDGKIPPLTAEADSRATPRDRGSFGQGPFDGPEDFSLFDRCITRGVVGSILPVIYGNGHYIVQTPGYVAISYEMVHDTRIIPLDGRPHPGPGLRLYLGDASWWRRRTSPTGPASARTATACATAAHCVWSNASRESTATCSTTA